MSNEEINRRDALKSLKRLFGWVATGTIGGAAYGTQENVPPHLREQTIKKDAAVGMVLGGMGWATTEGVANFDSKADADRQDTTNWTEEERERARGRQRDQDRRNRDPL